MAHRRHCRLLVSLLTRVARIFQINLMIILTLVNVGVLSVNCYILLKLNSSARQLIMMLFVFLSLLSSATNHSRREGVALAESTISEHRL